MPYSFELAWDGGEGGGGDICHIAREKRPININFCRTDNSVIDEMLSLYFITSNIHAIACHSTLKICEKEEEENDWYNLINLISFILIFVSLLFSLEIAVQKVNEPT